MQISRRAFLDYCKGSAAILGMGGIGSLEKVMANPGAPTVLWLQGSSCTGCSVSFLNRISSSAPATAADVLINTVNLAYHPTLMALSGQPAVQLTQDAYNKGGYVLVVEGGVPTAFGGAACWAWTFNGTDVTFLTAVTALAAKAASIIAVGTCASFGGVPAAPPNPTGVKSVSAATLRKTINIPGCPAHPDWMVWAIASVLTKSVGALDSYSRPLALYSRTVHSQCPRRETEEAHIYGLDNECLKELGCRGPSTNCNCPAAKWNNGVNWCVDANSQCLGCTAPGFPFASLGRRGHAD